MVYQSNIDYENSIFLTFDIDWAHDDVIKDTIEILEVENVKATIFITHDCAVLTELRSNKNFELGIHPNFNPSLNTETGSESYQQVTGRMMQLVPEAISVRSHHLVSSSGLLNYYAFCGLKIDANQYIPINSGIICRPYIIWNNILRVPHFWEDDLQLLENKKGISDISNIHDYEGIKIFDFHPIHVYLNTDSMDRYETARPHFRNINEISKLRNNESYGIRNALYDLINESKKRNYTFRTLDELLT